MNDLVTHRSGALAIPEDEAIMVLQSSLYPGAAIESVRMVLSYCRAQGLDPFQKPVHIVPMWDGKAKQMRDVVMPGIGLYRTQAARSGCAGVSEPEFGPVVVEKIGGQEITYPAWCRVTVRRRQPTGDVDEFPAKEFWRENYAVKGGQEKSIAPNAMWTKRPYGQIAKCAEAQALRKAFPEIGSAPAAEEMEGKSLGGEYIDNETGEVVRTAQTAPALPPYSAERFTENLPAWRDVIAAGRKTADQLIAFIESRNTMTDEQKAALRAPVAAEPAAEPTDNPTE